VIHNLLRHIRNILWRVLITLRLPVGFLYSRVLCSEVDGNDYLERLNEWQWREQAARGVCKRNMCFPINVNNELTADLLNKAAKAAKSIKYKKDIDLYNLKDYWPTSVEMMGMDSEDCDGQAILAWSILRDGGLADMNIGIVVLENTRTGSGHMVCAVHDKGSLDPVIMDNGLVVRSGFERMSKVLGKKWRPICGGGLFEVWIYEKVPKDR
jgi:hypothetical protein